VVRAGLVVRPLRPYRGFPQANLTEGQEACLFLTQHPTANFYVMQPLFGAVNKAGNPNFKKEVEEVRRAAKLLDDPKAGLRSEDAGERFLTAALLITRYRTPRPSAGTPLRTEPVDAKESKLILQALADADWGNPDLRRGQMNPQAVFFRLGLTRQDGWSLPPGTTVREIPQAAKKWLREHADTYRIQRYVREGERKD
jgi:hypothetical protein